jgi:F-type H+-transporting ATPase subunit epsilon
MADLIQLEIVTPERQVVNDRAEMVEIPGKDGYLGILPGHAPLITELGVGRITYTVAGRTERLAVVWGFAEVLPDKVTVLAETAERAEDIDIARAERAKSGAENALKNSQDDTERQRAELELERAVLRLDVAGKK